MLYFHIKNGSWYIWKEKQNLSFLSALFFAERQMKMHSLSADVLTVPII